MFYLKNENHYIWIEPPTHLLRESIANFKVILLDYMWKKCVGVPRGDDMVDGYDSMVMSQSIFGVGESYGISHDPIIVFNGFISKT